MNNQLNFEDYQTHHSLLINEELVLIAFFEKRKIKKEARRSAKIILQERGINESRIEILKNQIRKRKRLERREKLKEKNNNYGIIDFILAIL